jgi:hypothetical protein
MKKLYYTSYNRDDKYWRDIYVYEIVNDQPKLWFELEAYDSTFDEDEIQTWLDNNGFENREYNFYQL